MALQSLAMVLLQIVDQVDVDHEKITVMIEKNTLEHQRLAKEKVSMFRKKIEKRERALKRFKKKNPGQNMIVRMLEADIAQQKIGIANVEREIAVGEEMLKIIKDYDYQADIQTVGGFQPGFNVVFSLG